MTFASRPSNESPPSSPTTARKLSLRTGSPRSSFDSSTQDKNSSPFLHNLQQRFRKSSNASSTHSNESPTSSSAVPAPRQEHPRSRADATRTAKRYLLSVVRDDWTYPLPSTGNQPDPSIPYREVTRWIKREDGSDDEYSASKGRQQRRGIAQQRQSGRPDAEGKPAGAGLTPGGAVAGAGKKGAKETGASEEWKFETPDSFAQFAAERAHKKRRLVDEECRWNEGLRIWVGQRDAWTCASRGKPKKGVSRRERGSSAAGELRKGSGLRNLLTDGNGSVGSTTTDSTATGTTTDETGDLSNAASGWQQMPSPISPTPEQNEVVSPTREAIAMPTSAAESIVAEDEDEPYLPIYPPLFQEDDLLKERINPAGYSTIYSKVVIQVMTPTIPIPLTHMTRALVQGWKNEGQWPPGASVPVPQDAKTGKKSSKFGRWRRDRDKGRKEAAKDKVKGVVKGLVGKPSDGGLKDMGIEFEEQDSDEMLGNVELNRGLLEEKGKV